MNDNNAEPQDTGVFMANIWRKMRRWYLALIVFYVVCIAAISLSIIMMPHDYIVSIALSAAFIVFILFLTAVIIERAETRDIIFGSLLFARSGDNVFLARKPDGNTKDWTVFKQVQHRYLRDRVITLARARGRGATVDDAIRDYMSKV